MTNTINANTTATQIAEATPYLFLEDTDNNKILVCKKEWFADTALCQTYYSSGQLAVEDMDGEHDGEGCCYTVRSYDYWNGSNHQSIILSNEFDNRYPEVTDDEEIAKYVGLVEQAQTEDFRQMGTGYNGCEIDGYEVVESQWQGDFELYFISEVQEKW